MSTFLQIVNSAREDCGVSGGDLTTLSGVSGESLRFKNWAIKAWTEIQEAHSDWKWMRATYSFTTTADDGSYTATQAGITTRFGMWDKTYCTIYLTASGTSDQTELNWVEYEDFRSACLTRPVSSARPTHFTIGDSNELLIWPNPDSALYTISGNYFKSPQTLSADGDIPELPEQHDVIVFKTMVRYARFEAANEIYADALAEYSRRITSLRNKYLPTFQLCGPLV